MSAPGYLTIETGGVPIKAWVQGVPLESDARKQLENVASLPFIYRWVAAMPDVHVGKGATVGTVIATKGAIVPAAVGVDIGCGMVAARTTLRARDLPDNLFRIRCAIERAVPHGRTANGGKGDRGAWHSPPPAAVQRWVALQPGFDAINERHPKLGQANALTHLGTLGTGNHFVELCVDESERVWILLHSGSRGVGNRIGTYFIELALRDMERLHVHLPDRELAYFSEGSRHFDDYFRAVGWAQEFARTNRELMLQNIFSALSASSELPEFSLTDFAVNCHHNYVEREHHYGADVLVTRKGALRAGQGDLGIIPGSMGACTYIVRGKGNPESFCSCSHGAGRSMSRTAAKKRFSVAEHIAATQGVECRKDAEVLDETPMAYKDIAAVMRAQADLVEPIHTLRQVVCVKG